MKKRILSVLLTAAMLSLMLPMFAVATGADAIDWNNDQVIVIKSVDDFLAFRTQIRSGNTFIGKTVELGADLDLTDVKESSGKNGKMGGIDSNKYFAGTFDGKYHTISNMTVEGHGYQGAMFGALAIGLNTTVVIKNLAVINANVQGSQRHSLFYGAAYSSVSFENVYVNANVKGAGDFSGGYIGHVAGDGAEFSFTNCIFDGTVTNSGGTGAFVGQIIMPSDVAYYNTKAVKFTNCINVSSSEMLGKDNHPTTVEKTYVDCIQKYDEQTVGIGSGAQRYLDANGLDGFSTRTSGYPIPTTLRAFFAEATSIVEIKGLDGSVLEKLEVPVEGITVSELPKLDTDEEYFWYDLNTGSIVEAPITLTESTVIQAKTFGRNETSMLGVQLGAIKDGKQGIRFIGGNYKLEGVAVGFEISIKYKDASGNIVERNYKKLVNTVYSEINATENGEMVNATAKELGAPYVYAVVLEGVPTNVGQLDITVKSIKAVGNGSICITGSEMSFSMINGAVDGELTPLS